MFILVAIRGVEVIKIFSLSFKNLQLGANLEHRKTFDIFQPNLPNKLDKTSIICPEIEDPKGLSRMGHFRSLHHSKGMF